MLRHYQITAIDQIRAEFKGGNRRVLLHMATGLGKTVVFCEIIKSLVKNNKKCIMIVRGKQLVEQASQRLFREHVPHGVRQSNHWNKNYSASVQVCSVDTLISREEFPPADVVIVDEAHHAISDGYKRVLSQYPHAFILGVTATPYTDKPLTHVGSKILKPISMQQGIDEGFLVPFRYFAPNNPDLTDVKIVNKEYKNDQLETKMSPLTGDILEHWKNIAENRPSIGFAVNIHHSKSLVEIFNSSGIKAEHVEADTPQDERMAVLERLKAGETKVVFNVGILCTGVDIPFLGAIIMARPTKSYNLFVQQIGRGTRPYPAKENCILLDHAGNTLRHGFPTEEPEPDLKGKFKTDQTVAKSRICKKCYAIYRGSMCPYCGLDAPKDPIAIENGEGELTELVVDPLVIKIRKRFKELDKLRKEKGYKKGYAYYTLVDEFGLEYVGKSIALPQWFYLKMAERVARGDNPFRGSPYKAAR